MLKSIHNFKLSKVDARTEKGLLFYSHLPLQQNLAKEVLVASPVIIRYTVSDGGHTQRHNDESFCSYT